LGSYSGAIARLLSQGRPETYSDNLQTLEAMPEVQQHIVSAAYLYSRRVPRDDQQDVFQELVSRIWDALARRKAKGETTLLYPKAYTLKVARCEWIRWLKSRSRENSRRIPFEDVEDTPESGMIEAVEAGLEAQRIWRVLPANIQAIVRKRLNGQHNTGPERERLGKYLQKHGDYIRDLAGLPHSYGKRKRGDFEDYGRRGEAVGIRRQCKRGHRLSLANTYVGPDGSRECQICRRERVRRHREKRKREKERLAV